MTEDNDSPSRSELRRSAKQKLTQRIALLEKCCRLPDHLTDSLDVSRDTAEAIQLIRRLKSSGARARLVKNLARRGDGDDWLEIEKLVDGTTRERGQETEREKEVIALRERLLSDGNDALHSLRETFPNADHQRLRQLVLNARRNPESPSAKGAKKALLKLLRALSRDAADVNEA